MVDERNQVVTVVSNPDFSPLKKKMSAPSYISSWSGTAGGAPRSAASRSSDLVLEFLGQLSASQETFYR